MRSEHRKGLAIFCFVVLGIVTGFSVLHFGGATARNTVTASPLLALATNAASSTPSTSTSTETAAATFVPPVGYVLYRNQPYHFSFYYPPNLQAHTFNEEGGAFTVALQEPTTNEGFEVYVTPYSGTQITEARFKLDEPSGVIQQQTNVMIDGTHATMFYGTNAIMGDTREVWFIKGGLLYEVTTYKQLDAWLAQIMQTWQFTP
jgi:hypothetical protein